MLHCVSGRVVFLWIAIYAFATLAHGARVSKWVNYTADGIASRGFISYDDSVCTSANKCPGVMVVHKWTGLNEYEMGRACLLADMGYVAFAADIYGIERTSAWKNGGGLPDWSEAAALHQSNATKFMGKINDGLAKLMNFDNVDVSKLAAIGYCFGGTGVINLAMMGHGNGVPTGLLGAIAYHAVSNGLLNATDHKNATSRPRLSVHSAAADHAITTSIMAQMEEDLESVGAQYEVFRYGSHLQHGFTEWNTERYSSFGDQRSWASTKSLLQGLFRDARDESHESSKAALKMRSGRLLDAGGVGRLRRLSAATHVAENVSYMVDNVMHTGYLVYDNGICMSISKCPGVVIVPDFRGVGPYVMQRADMLAGLGYVAFVADIYGANVTDSWQGPGERPDWSHAAAMHRSNATLYMGKISAGLQRLMSYNFVDISKLGAMGYCFGGTGVMNLAIAGHGGPYNVPSGLKVALAYHAGATGLLSIADYAAASRPRLVVHQGRADHALPIDVVSKIEQEFEAAQGEFEVAWYGSGVGHAYTVPEAATFGHSYNQVADTRSWSATEEIFEEVFGNVAESRKPEQCAASAHSDSLLPEIHRHLHLSSQRLRGFGSTLY